MDVTLEDLRDLNLVLLSPVQIPLFRFSERKQKVGCQGGSESYTLLTAQP